MVIKEERPITMAEVSGLVGDGESGKRIRDFIKEFTKTTYEDAVKLKKELEELKILKLKDEHFVKIVDFMPIDASELNKVLTEVSLDSDEVTKIVDVVKKY